MRQGAGLCVANKGFIQAVCSNFSGRQGAIGCMALTRSQLVDGFLCLDAELLRLETNGEPEEAMQLALERMVYTSTRTVGPPDRLWWWGQLYSAMDQRVARLERSAGRGCGHES